MTKNRQEGVRKKQITLALQGGGTHLAFSWGVIDYLLETGHFTFEGGSGTSAGGLLCMALAQGLIKNGQQGGRDELRAFWKMISEQGIQCGLAPSYLDKVSSNHGVKFSLAVQTLNFFKINQLSPYFWNLFGFELFRDLLTKFFEFDKLSTQKEFKIFLTATNVQNAKLKIFTGNEISLNLQWHQPACP